ncbi:putative F-box protein At1g67623 isoform X1 [Gossypium hirsutum]|uniref:F-box protein At1g67623 isoform X1 n=1 Tax=Gossypium hirsutum TaxID=3635 RepID=A0A1U8JZB5_GOSHI|nr:putative F-box protein At1g67623 isoform X1 [Gossypium hirsutum]
MLGSSKPSTPLPPFLFSLSIRKIRTRNQIKSFQEGYSKLMEKENEGNKISSFQGFLKLTKRVRKSKTNSFTTSIFSLPNELLITEVLARVAATSVCDFFNLILSSKAFHQTANDNYILGHVSLDKVPVIPWRLPKQAFFLEKCKETGHPEALYREGVVQYFSFAKEGEGLNCLNSAAKVGHVGAAYVLGVILLCIEEGGKGRRLLNYVKSKKGIGESRKKFKDVINRLWLNNFLEPKPNACPMQAQHRRKQRWPSDDDDDNDVSCEACGCHLQVIFVCNLLRGS